MDFVCDDNADINRIYVERGPKSLIDDAVER